MIGIVLTGHGSFPNGMLESVQLIAGEVTQIKVVPFLEDPDKLKKDLEVAIQEVENGDGVVCFADLAGGTPFNVSSKIASTMEGVRVIGGVNSPMILSGLFQRDMDIDSFTAFVLKEAKENMKLFSVKKRKESVESDGI
ncbi:hypothetical protein RWE15_04445 [Virgibacillus halophilus]|uniref:PTS EIIA type-4 domain-containing protein n=1 Tax=Tigheibacillus halophilus TaxID=361280 RepID=A0ABU5C3G1_9BACI|nr:hypothetical protein [Virgibacillus halophilus]